jgi:hypothetical protein
MLIFWHVWLDNMNLWKNNFRMIIIIIKSIWVQLMDNVQFLSQIVEIMPLPRALEHV